MNYLCTSAWGKCADSIFFHIKVSLTESVTKVLSVKKPNKVSKTEKLQYLFLAIFWTSVPKIYFCRGDWTLGCLPMKFWDVSNISIRLNLSKVGLLHGGYHVVANTLWSWPNHSQAHIEKLLCSGHFHSGQLLQRTQFFGTAWEVGKIKVNCYLIFKWFYLTV